MFCVLGPGHNLPVHLHRDTDRAERQLFQQGANGGLGIQLPFLAVDKDFHEANFWLPNNQLEDPVPPPKLSQLEEDTILTGRLTPHP